MHELPKSDQDFLNLSAVKKFSKLYSTEKQAQSKFHSSVREFHYHPGEKKFLYFQFIQTKQESSLIEILHRFKVLLPNCRKFLARLRSVYQISSAIFFLVFPVLNQHI